MTVETKTLAVCDYACRLEGGELCPVRFERKSLGDLFGTMAQDKNYQRFKREMNRCKSMGIGMILIIEASFLDVVKGYKYSKFDGRAMIRKLFTLHVKYPDIIIYPAVFTNSRSESSAYIKSYYEGWHKNLQKIERESKRADSHADSQ